MAQETDRDVREEVAVSLFWRALIGDLEYVKFNPDDMLRWYDALTLRGPDEIRDLMTERYSTRPMSTVVGIVARAPHPPSWLIREWLMQHEHKVQTKGYWYGAAAFIVFWFMMAQFMYGCSVLTPVNPYFLHPPDTNLAVSAPTGPMANQNGAEQKSPPVTFTPTMTGAHSTGIAGAATGVSPAGGATGATNSGASAGSISPAPSVGSSQP